MFQLTSLMSSSSSNETQTFLLLVSSQMWAGLVDTPQATPTDNFSACLLLLFQLWSREFPSENKLPINIPFVVEAPPHHLFYLNKFVQQWAELWSHDTTRWTLLPVV